MKELVFKVVFLSDIVLPATSNTEGKVDNLDFIAGSNFLGMAAREYDEYDDSFSIFHSGKVRFGDANILHKRVQTYKMPLVYFYEKLDESVMLNQLHYSLEKLNQAKQHRQGYITKDLNVTYIDYTYAQKSAYDKSKRKSKESSMYGYSAIPEGTKWQFSVKYDDTVSDEDIKRIKSNLLGKKRLGKSKSSQYGLIHISEKGNIEEIENKPSSNEVFVYVKSRLALVDKNGHQTYNLTNLAEGLTDDNIDWSRTQIRTSSYSRYDGTRRNQDYERIIINAGSVIVLKNIDKNIISSLQKGVGTYLSEGFGEVLINPAFLEKEQEIVFKKNDEKNINEKVSISDPVVKFLQNREEKKKATLDLANRVAQFMELNKPLYEKIKPAQWGTIRSICIRGDVRFKEEIRGYLSSGKVTWDEKAINALLKEEHSLTFIKLVSMQIPKQKEEPTK